MKKRKAVTIIAIIFMISSFVSVSARTQSPWNEPPQTFDDLASGTTVSKDITIGELPDGGSNPNNYSNYVTTMVYRSFWTTKQDSDWYLQIHYFEKDSIGKNTVNGPFPVGSFNNLSPYASFALPYNLENGKKDGKYLENDKVSVEYYKYNSSTGNYDFYRHGNDVNTFVQAEAIIGQYIISNWSSLTPSEPIRKSITEKWNPIGEASTAFMTKAPKQPEKSRSIPNSDLPKEPNYNVQPPEDPNYNPSYNWQPPEEPNYNPSYNWQAPEEQYYNPNYNWEAQGEPNYHFNTPGYQMPQER